MTAPDVVVIGAGVAGLACGRRLAACGIAFQILDTSGPGSGDSVFLPAFPEARRVLDAESLDLRPLTIEPVLSRRERLKVGAFLDRLSAEPASCAEFPVIDLLRWTGGFSETRIDRFWRPFLACFTLDRSLATSSRLVRLVLQAYSRGGLAIPARGTDAIREQLAAGLPIRGSAVVKEIGLGSVQLGTGEVMRPRAIVAATTGLLPEFEVNYQWMAATTIEYELPSTGESELWLNSAGPVNHAVRNGSRVNATVLGPGLMADADLDRLVRSQLVVRFPDTASWRLEKVERKPQAMPDQTAGKLDPWQRPVRVRPGLYVCGGHQDNGTLDGELTSGFRTAQAVMEDLSAERC